MELEIKELVPDNARSINPNSSRCSHFSLSHPCLLISGPEKVVCCSLCLCMACAVLSSVSLVYLTFIVYMPAKRELVSGLLELPVMCTTTTMRETDQCESVMIRGGQKIPNQFTSQYLNININDNDIVCPDLAGRRIFCWDPGEIDWCVEWRDGRAYHCIDIYILQMMIKESDCPEHFYLYDCTQSNSSY